MALARFRHGRHDTVWVRTENIVSILPVTDEVGVPIRQVTSLDIAGRDNPLHVQGDPLEIADYVNRFDAGEDVTPPGEGRV